MILSDNEILSCIEDGRIIITNFNTKHLNPNTVDLTLNPECKIYETIYHGKKSFDFDPFKYSELNPAELDCREVNPTVSFIIPEEGHVLKPGVVYLYNCNEDIGVPKPKDPLSCSHLCAEIAGKSSLGRLGLMVHVTAGFIDSGFVGSLVLELVCAQPIRIYPNMKICQIKFIKVYGRVLESYGDKTGSKYMNQTGVQASKMHENFKDDNTK